MSTKTKPLYLYKVRRHFGATFGPDRCEAQKVTVFGADYYAIRQAGVSVSEVPADVDKPLDVPGFTATQYYTTRQRARDAVKQARRAIAKQRIKDARAKVREHTLALAAAKRKLPTWDTKEK